MYQKDLLNIIYSYLKPYEIAVIAGSTNYIVEAAEDGWDAIITTQKLKYSDLILAGTAAIKNNHVCIIAHFGRRIGYISADIYASWVMLAAMYGRLEIMQLVQSWISGSILITAAAAGHMNCVIELLKYVAPTIESVEVALLNGHAEVAKLLIRPDFDGARILNSAIEGGVMSIMREYRSYYGDGDPLDLSEIVEHPVMVNYILQMGWFRPDELISYSMISIKSLALIKSFGGILDPDPEFRINAIQSKILSFF